MKQIYNPYMPSWEYVPDGEPHVFEYKGEKRVYIYGSHDCWNGCVFCLGDFVCYSAPVTDLKNWRYEGIIYPRVGEDHCNDDGRMVLYAPDVTQGPDGRFYIYYVYDKVGFVSVAVSDSPAGKYKFYGYVHYKDGTRLGEKEGDEPQFDPAVITEGNTTYLYTAFCGNHMKDRHGAMVTVLGKDMLTIEEPPVFVVPGDEYSKGTSFENHAFFEASSIRKFNNTYYFVYSSEVMHELCYATSKYPTKDFVYGGVVISNCDMGISSYKPADMPAAYGANNHGGIEYINGDYYIFYHRHTNGTWYSRQGCSEKIQIGKDGKITQAEITSCGLNGGPLLASPSVGEYPSYIVCNMFTDKPCPYVSGDKYPKVMQDGGDGDENLGYIANITDNSTFGFKYFNFDEIGDKETEFKIWVRGYANGEYEIKNTWDGKVLGKIKIEFENVWREYSTKIVFPKGTHALYLTFKGNGCHQLRGFKFI